MHVLLLGVAFTFLRLGLMRHTALTATARAPAEFGKRLRSLVTLVAASLLATRIPAKSAE